MKYPGILAFVSYLTAALVAGAAQVRMGFPQRNAEGFEGVAFIGAECRLGAGGYTCPRCRARVAELPSRCRMGLGMVRIRAKGQAGRSGISGTVCSVH